MHRSSRLAASTSVAALLSVCSLGVMAQEAVAADATITLNGSSATATGSGVTVNGNTVTITAGGSYQLSGTLNGQVVVNTDEANTVTLVLSGANITSSTTAAINIAMAGSVTVELAAGTTNSLSGGIAGDDAANAALFSAEDMVITGSGSLTARSNTADGIISKDTLTIESGTITVNAGDDGIRGKDFLLVKGGTIDVTATTDGLKSNNDSDQALGYTTISGGTITITAGDDAIKGVSAANISGGTVKVTKAYEGIEALKVNISGGNTSIVSTDDGINAVEEGIDEFAASNIASVTVSGGTTVVSCGASMGGGEGGIDTNGPTNFVGGTVVGAGMTSMAVMSVPPTNGQGWVSGRFNAAQNAGTIVHVVQNNQVLASWRSMKRFQEVVFSNNRISNGQSYQFYTGGSIGTDLGGGLSTAGGNISGASQATTATAGQYSGGLLGMGFGGNPGGTTPGGGWPTF